MLMPPSVYHTRLSIAALCGRLFNYNPWTTFRLTETQNHEDSWNPNIFYETIEEFEAGAIIPPPLDHAWSGSPHLLFWIKKLNKQL